MCAVHNKMPCTLEFYENVSLDLTLTFLFIIRVNQMEKKGFSTDFESFIRELFTFTQKSVQCRGACFLIDVNILLVVAKANLYFI